MINHSLGSHHLSVFLIGFALGEIIRDFGIIKIPAFEKSAQYYQLLLSSVGYIICDGLPYNPMRIER